MREKGSFDFSGNFEVKYKGNLDARRKVTYAELLEFTAQDYIYNGMCVEVYDEDISIRGIYMCINNTNLSNISSWERISGGSNTVTMISGQAVLNGDGPPSNTLGVDGNFYLDTLNTVLYGPKTAGAWSVAGVSLIGPAGKTPEFGVDYFNGERGDVGPKGDIGLTGPKGDKGDKGDIGPIGPQGIQGIQGLSVFAGGANIISGTTNPVSSTGVDGEYYINTTTHVLFGPKASGAWPTVGISLVGPTGPQGPAGTNGTNGLAAPISTDGTLADNLDTEVPSEKAVKTYVDAKPTYRGRHTTLDALKTAIPTGRHGDYALIGDGSDVVGGGVVDLSVGYTVLNSGTTAVPVAFNEVSDSNNNWSSTDYVAKRKETVIAHISYDYSIKDTYRYSGSQPSQTLRFQVYRGSGWTDITTSALGYQASAYYQQTAGYKTTQWYGNQHVAITTNLAEGERIRFVFNSGPAANRCTGYFHNGATLNITASSDVIPISDLYVWDNVVGGWISTTADIAFQTYLANYYTKTQIDASLLGKADLVSGKILASQLPSYVDDVEEYATLVNFPATGESGKIYIALDTNVTYRWGGTSYVTIGSSLALGETSSTAYRGDRGKIAYDFATTIVPSTSGGSGTNNSGILIWGTGGTLGSNAYTSIAYLPLTGGTLTGALTGTSATFSSNITLSTVATSAGSYNVITRNTTTGVIEQVTAAALAATNSILNGTSVQTANFYINGNGRIDTSLGLGLAAATTFFAGIAANTTAKASLLLTPSATDYTGTTAGSIWNNAGELKFIDGTIVNRLIKAYNNALLAGGVSGSYSMRTNQHGDLGVGDQEVEAIVIDTDVVTAITGATYTNNRATIVPANSKIMYTGQMYDDGTTYTYIAINDNVVRRF